MLSRWSLAALWLLPAQLAFADSTKTIQACTTLLGKSSKSPVPTASIALTFTSKAVVKSTSTPVTTITPAPGTTLISTTLTSTTTSTLLQQTDTFSSTQTSVTTSTFIPSTVTSTVYVSTSTTTTTVQGTITVQPSSGFIPANSALPQKRGLEDIKFPRRAAAANALIERAAKPSAFKCIKGKNGQPTYSPAVYPTSVACAKLVEVFQTSTSIVSGTQTSTVTASPPPPSSITTTFSTTVTSTTMPVDASTTITFYTTVTATSTVVPTTTTSLTATVTQTQTQPSATYYAACGPNNQLTSVNGVPIDGANFYNFADSSDISNPYDCCVACLQSPTCGASTYFEPNFCYLARNGGTCNPAVPALGVYTDASAGGGVSVSSSNCGTVNLAPQ